MELRKRCGEEKVGARVFLEPAQRWWRSQVLPFLVAPSRSPSSGLGRHTAKVGSASDGADAAGTRGRARWVCKFYLKGRRKRALWGRPASGRVCVCVERGVGVGLGAKREGIKPPLPRGQLRVGAPIEGGPRAEGFSIPLWKAAAAGRERQAWAQALEPQGCVCTKTGLGRVLG